MLGKFATFFLLLGSGLACAQTVNIVYTFGAAPDGSLPTGSTQGRDGNLYGTTYSGGKYNLGTAFRVSPKGSEAILYDFYGELNRNPAAGLVLATNGKFYGVTNYSPLSEGTLFDISAGGNFTDDHTFVASTDGGKPYVNPIEASDGNLYGTTFGHFGGAVTHPSTVYKLDESGNFGTVYTFPKVQYPFGVIQGADGNLYGATEVSSVGGFCGEIFKMTTSGVMLFVNHLTYFTPGPCLPTIGLFQASDGNFYGASEFGGTYNGGTIFKMTPGGIVSTVVSFNPQTEKVGLPTGFVEGTDGNLYGAAVGGNGSGALVQLTLAGVYTTLYSFPPPQPRYSGYPTGVPIQHTNGKFYGTIALQTLNSDGEVYSLDMGLAPFVAFVKPTGMVGETAEILGQGFTGTTSVTFNGVAAASFKVSSDTYLTAVVPSGATSGPVMVTTPTATLNSNQSYRISPSLAIP